MRPRGVTAAGQKKGIFRRERAKAGQPGCGGKAVGVNFGYGIALEIMPRVSAEPIGVMSLPVRVPGAAIPGLGAMASRRRDWITNS
jgi:hypothetical protein